MKPQMIEKITDLYCANNHNLEPYMIVFNLKLQQKDRILCTKCMDEYDNINKMITFKKAQQLIEENQTKCLELLENSIEPNIKQVELLQKHLDSLKSYLNQELDSLIENTKEWIKSFNQIRQLHKEYSFLKELDKLIQNEKIQVIDESSFNNQIIKINQALSVKINSKLQQFVNFNEQKQCSYVLNNILNGGQGTNFDVYSEQSSIVQKICSNPTEISYQIENNAEFQSEVQQIEYYVYEDLQNFVNLLYSLKAVKEHFKEYPYHPMTVLCRNKVILQLNLSNAIHFDLMSQYQNNLRQVLLKEKENAKNIINQFKLLLGDEYLQHIDYYISNSLNEKLSVKNLILETLDESNSQNNYQNFNLFGQAQDAQKILSHWIKSKTYNSNIFDSFIFKAICYKYTTEIKLISNFPASSFNPKNK
ncbi:unnamed protein product [Paramecium octaurelia]|uniref:Uncharacterized protein n=1 Tax=Paramecium octaurelia TaxID=43137 RepID=A0A8S1X0U2_PAROT|nr:unnamed protein product [Paramecium octaurelia]